MIDQSGVFVPLAVLASFFVGLSKGGLPTVGNLAVPTLALTISPVAAAAVLLPIYVASDTVGMVLYRRQYSKRNLAILMPSALLSIAVGWAFSSHLSSDLVGTMVGILGVAFCLDKWIWSQNTISSKAAKVAPGYFGAV